MNTSTSTAVPLPPSAPAPSVAAAPATATPWRDKLNGVLFVGLMAAAVMQLADLPAIRQLGFSPLVVGHRLRHAVRQLPARHDAG